MYDEEVVGHLRSLLEQGEVWVMRDRWVRWLRAGDDRDTAPIDGMTADGRAAALAWLSQQQHALYSVLEGGRRAPDGWVEGLPLWRGLAG